MKNILEMADGFDEFNHTNTMGLGRAGRKANRKANRASRKADRKQNRRNNGIGRRLLRLTPLRAVVRRKKGSSTSATEDEKPTIDAMPTTEMLTMGTTAPAETVKPVAKTEKTAPQEETPTGGGKPVISGGGGGGQETTSKQEEQEDTADEPKGKPATTSATTEADEKAKSAKKKKIVMISIAIIALAFFAIIQKNNPTLFKHTINAQNYEKWASNIKKWSGQSKLTLGEFIAVFCIVYNETGRRFQSISEQGDEAYFNKYGYDTKQRGRGFIQVTWKRNYDVVLPQLGNYDFDSLTSEQLDDLFFKNDNVAYGALRVFFTDARLAKSTFDGLKFGQYKAFGKAIGGSWTYGGFFEDRVNYILKALSAKKLDSSVPFYKTTWFWIAVLVIFAVILWLYRDLVLKSYKTIL